VSLSAKLSTIASKLIKKFGVKVTFTNKTSTSFDAATGIDTVTTTTFTGYGLKANFDKSEVDNENVLFSDIKFLFEDMGTVPVISDTCTIGTKIYRVLAVNTIDPADEKIIYMVQLRV